MQPLFAQEAMQSLHFLADINNGRIRVMTFAEDASWKPVVPVFGVCRFRNGAWDFEERAPTETGAWHSAPLPQLRPEHFEEAMSLAGPLHPLVTFEEGVLWSRCKLRLSEAEFWLSVTGQYLIRRDAAVQE
jgi:hypothetical protein